MKSLVVYGAIAAIAVMVIGVTPALLNNNQASAKIEEVPIECQNPSGATPPGQQPECQNENLDQISENQNPAGHAPPGQNP